MKSCVSQLHLPSKEEISTCESILSCLDLYLRILDGRNDVAQRDGGTINCVLVTSDFAVRTRTIKQSILVKDGNTNVLLTLVKYN
jgi:hypothetical protein